MKFKVFKNGMRAYKEGDTDDHGRPIHTPYNRAVDIANEEYAPADPGTQKERRQQYRKEVGQTIRDHVRGTSPYLRHK